MAEEQVCKFGGRHIGATGDEPDIGAKTVGDCEDAVVAVVQMQGANKVNGDAVETAIEDWQGITSGDVEFVQLGAHVWPIVRGAQSSEGLIGSEMPKRVVREAKETFAQVANPRDNQAVAGIQ
ncbi:hypothetical protein EIP86_007487 [Pleurotus ostreatoroseus]|nr:hypothetical protein EIP86_007487 [Pleurotus ostreatoroseus]